MKRRARLPLAGGGVFPSSDQRPQRPARTRSHLPGTEAAAPWHDVQQLILLSVILATFVIPVVLVRTRAACNYLAVVKPMVVFVAVYVFLLLVVYPRLF